MSKDTPNTTTAAAAAGRILSYLERRRNFRGIDHEEIHAFDVSPEGGVYLRASDLEAIVAALGSPAPADGGDNVAVPREVIAGLYRFLHQAWTGTGSVTEEGSHGKDLLDWRDAMSFYHRQKAVGSAAPAGLDDEVSL